jgi:hypothetical protein
MAEVNEAYRIKVLRPEDSIQMLSDAVLKTRRERTGFKWFYDKPVNPEKVDGKV